MTAWQSLFLWSEQSQQLIDNIRHYLQTHQYTIYNPFGALPGMSYPRTIKTFLAKPENGWSRLLVDADSAHNQSESLAQHLSEQVDCLSVRLEGGLGLIHAFRDGAMLDLLDWSKPHLKDKNTGIAAIINAESFDLEPLHEGQVGDVPLESLPGDIQDMARQLDTKQVNKLFEKLSNRLLKASGRNQARSIISAGNQWDSQGGQYIRAFMSSLTIGENWRTPDFPTLRTAYTVRSRQAEGMSMLFPGDEEALKAVPDALDYHPLYGGTIEA